MGHSSLILLLALFLVWASTLSALNHSDGVQPLWRFSNNNSRIHHPRIIGGTIAREKEFPYMVCVMMYYNHICGGTLVAETWVLTAAHCVVDFDRSSHWPPFNTFPPSSFQVMVGSTYCDFRHGGILLRVAEVHAHHKFDLSDNTYDICLLKLETPATLSDYVQLVPLPREVMNASEGTRCLALGWGVSRAVPAAYAGSYGSGEDKLHKVTLPIYSIDKCQRVHRQVTRQQICTLEVNKDACVGDSGGPLMCEDVQLAITSYGRGCADYKYPGVFQRVDFHLLWLEWAKNQPPRHTEGDDPWRESPEDNDHGASGRLTPAPVEWLLWAAAGTFALTL